MPSLPNRGETGAHALPQAMSGDHRLTRACTAAATANKSSDTQNALHAVSAAEVQTKKGNAETATPSLPVSPLHFIAESLTLLLGTEKVGSTVQKRIEKTIAYARDADAKEKGKSTSPASNLDEDPLKLSIRADLVLMYDVLAKLLGDIKHTTNSTLSNVNSLSTKATEISGEIKSLAAKLGKVSDCTDKIASSTTAYRDALTTTKPLTTSDKLDPKVLGDMERRDKQIWLDMAENGDVPILSKSLTALVEQANKALDSITDTDRAEHPCPYLRLYGPP